MSKLFTKIKNYSKKILRCIIPHNSHLRPHSVYTLHSDNACASHAQGVIQHPIYTRHVTKLNISEQLYRACSGYWKPQRQVITDYLVAEVPNGRIHTDNERSVAVISRHNQLIEEVSLSLKKSKATEAGYNSIFEQRYFTKPVKFTGTVFSMLSGGAGLNNISHWFLDVLPRLHLLHKSGLYNQVDWFLVPSLRYDYQVETLKLLHIPEEKLIAGDVYPHLTADSIIASTAPRGSHTLVPNWLCEFIREAFLPLAETGSPGEGLCPNIYISRSDSNMRKITNEAALEAELQQHGFQTVVSSKLSVLEKITLFATANTVVSATGAGLVHILFCKPGTKIIELFNEGFVIEPFYDIATKINLNYNYVICKNKRKIRSAAQGQREDLTVDVARVVERLHYIKKPDRFSQKTQHSADM